MPFLASDLLSALPRLRRYARFLTDDPVCAEDMVEETIKRVRQSAHEPPLKSASIVGLLSLLRTVYAEQFAPGRPRGPISPLAVRESTAPGGTNLTGRASRPSGERANDFLPQLHRVPIELREVLVLVAVERMSYEETAMLLSVPVATVFARLVQARQALRSVEFEPMTTPKSAG